MFQVTNSNTLTHAQASSVWHGYISLLSRACIRTHGYDMHTQNTHTYACTHRKHAHIDTQENIHTVNIMSDSEQHSGLCSGYQIFPYRWFTSLLPNSPAPFNQQPLRTTARRTERQPTEHPHYGATIQTEQRPGTPTQPSQHKGSSCTRQPHPAPPCQCTVRSQDVTWSKTREWLSLWWSAWTLKPDALTQTRSVSAEVRITGANPFVSS